MIELRVKEVMLQKGFKPTISRLEKFGIGRNTARHMMSGKLKSIKFEDLELLCILLNCTPKEILKVTIPEKYGVGENHPLMEWTKTIIPTPLQDIHLLNPTQIEKVAAFMKSL
jgi:DNA-binding Xre family transcriptional regulator